MTPCRAQAGRRTRVRSSRGRLCPQCRIRVCSARMTVAPWATGSEYRPELRPLSLPPQHTSSADRELPPVASGASAPPPPTCSCPNIVRPRTQQLGRSLSWPKPRHVPLELLRAPPVVRPTQPTRSHNCIRVRPRRQKSGLFAHATCRHCCDPPHARRSKRIDHA